VLDLAEPAAEPWVLGCLKTEAYLRQLVAEAGSPRRRGFHDDAR
jgi:hypothetical protein